MRKNKTAHPIHNQSQFLSEKNSRIIWLFQKIVVSLHSIMNLKLTAYGSSTINDEYARRSHGSG